MEDNVSIVTGASRGIGRAIAIELGKHGGKVVVNYQGREDAARETAKMVEEVGGQAIVEQANVGDSKDAEQLIESALAAFGRIDILVNNAGITRDGLLLRMKDEDFDAVLDTNLKGAFYMTRQVARPMMKQRYGRIINITSVSGVIGNPGQANYASAKAGMIGLTKSAAKELSSRNITVNAIAPGFIETDMTDAMNPTVMQEMQSLVPLGRLGKPEDVALVAKFLASDAARYMTGQVLHVDGGMVM